MLYVPQVGQAVCGSLGERHESHVAMAGAVAFHCERRIWVLARDIRRFGTATVLPSLTSGLEPGQLDTVLVAL